MTKRLYNFFPGGGSDPGINPSFLVELKATCPQNGDVNVRLPIDRGSERVFDKQILQNIKDGFAVLESDSRLNDDIITNAIIDSYLGILSPIFGPSFEADFVESIVKMGHIGVKTGQQGAIDEPENNRKDVAHISAQVADLANVVLSIQNNLTNIFQALRDPTLPSILPQPPPMPQHPPPTSNQPPYPLGTPFSRYQGGPIRLEFPTIKGYNAEVNTKIQKVLQEEVLHALAKSFHDKPHLGTIPTQPNLEAVGAPSCSTTKVDLPISSYRVNPNPARYETIKYQLATRATCEGSLFQL
ncbi:hypothetical protein WN944_006608 [Citrus x changshan-huyou]|uniref:Peroxidase n=1 Tax=Citrus x changshan-huyou TaxID=2935761 RepID=A0AAP0MQX8_9ROSI